MGVGEDFDAHEIGLAVEALNKGKEVTVPGILVGVIRERVDVSVQWLEDDVWELRRVGDGRSGEAIEGAEAHLEAAPEGMKNATAATVAY